MVGNDKRPSRVKFDYVNFNELNDLTDNTIVMATVSFNDGHAETYSMKDWFALQKANSDDLRYFEIFDWLLGELRVFSEDRLKQDTLHYLQEGTWKSIVQSTMDSMVVGEEKLKWLLFYSMVSSCLGERFHTIVNGDSQKGKSYIEEKISDLFPVDRVINIKTMSAKAVYYNTEQYGPDYYKNKILMLDEFADLTEETRNTVKALMSLGSQPLVNDTVNEKKKAVRQIVEGRPVVIANSAELFDDELTQIKNRFFTASIDESEELDREVNERQRKLAKYGPTVKETEDLDLAKTITAVMVSDLGYDVLIPLIDEVGQRDLGNRGEFKRFQVLVSCIARTNMHRRPIISDGGCCYILASLSDMKEAIELWGHYDRSQTMGIPPRLQRVLVAMSSDLLGLEDITDRVNAASKRKKAAKTVKNYLDDLAGYDLVTTIREKSDDDKKPSYRYALLNPHNPPTSQFFPKWIGKDNNELRDELTKVLETLADKFPNIPIEWNSIVDELIDIELLKVNKKSESAHTEKKPLPMSEESMLALIGELRDLKLHHDKNSLVEAGFNPDHIDRLVMDGKITIGATGFYYWRG